jgi:hypothetical protein
MVFDGTVDKKLQEVLEYCKRENIFVKTVLYKENQSFESLLTNEVTTRFSMCEETVGFEGIAVTSKA